MTIPDKAARRIALVGYMHGRGGIQTHTRFLAEGLRSRGHEVLVVSPPPMEAHAGVAASGDFSVYGGLGDLVRTIRNFRPDAVMVVGTGWKSMLGALAAGRACRKVFFEVMSGARGGFLDPRMLTRFGFDALVGQGSPVTARFVREFGWDGPAVTIPALPEPLERQYDIPARRAIDVSGGVRFVYFGRVEPPKNVRLLIERFGDFAGERDSLDIWGGGSDGEAMRRLIAERGLQDRIALRGYYPEGEEYIALLQQYDLLLLPTVAEEGAPLVLLEAMACGLPFAANGMGGIPDYANPDCAITDGTIADFVPAVQEMVGRLHAGDVDPARLQRHYAENFGFERLIDRWDAFFTGLERG